MRSIAVANRLAVVQDGYAAVTNMSTYIVL